MHDARHRIASPLQVRVENLGAAHRIPDIQLIFLLNDMPGALYTDI